MTDSSSVDSLLEKMGDCGLFQVLMVSVVHGSVLSSEWSTTFMAFGNYNPGWRCNDSDTLGLFADAKFKNVSDEFTSLCDNYEHCRNVVYSTDTSTVVTEWDLACDKSWVTSLMLSVQGGGYLIGIFVAGFLNNKIGRKPTHYGALGLHVVHNSIAVFSVNWQMFVIMRFLIGLTAGSIGLTNFVYPIEFVTNKWRAVVSGLPFSSFGALLFALIAMWLRDWRAIHLVTAILTGVLFLTVVWIPESIRWLAVHGYTERAKRAARKVGKVNGKKPQSLDLEVIYAIADHESKKGDDNGTVSILDFYRHGFATRTSILMHAWVTVLVCYTIVMFGIKALSGNFYLNLIFFSVAPSVLLPTTPFLNNYFGRKFSLLTLMGLLALCCVSLVTVDFIPLGLNKGVAIVVLSILAMIFIHASWTVVMLFSVELYPTRLRSLAYSYLACIARIGAMASAFLIPRDERSAYVSHIVMAVFTVSAFESAFLFPETKGQYLYESFPEE